MMAIIYNIININKMATVGTVKSTSDLSRQKLLVSIVTVHFS